MRRLPPIPYTITCGLVAGVVASGLWLGVAVAMAQDAPLPTDAEIAQMQRDLRDACEDRRKAAQDAGDDEQRQYWLVQRRLAETTISARELRRAGTQAPAPVFVPPPAEVTAIEPGDPNLVALLQAGGRVRLAPGEHTIPPTTIDVRINLGMLPGATLTIVVPEGASPTDPHLGGLRLTSGAAGSILVACVVDAPGCYAAIMLEPGADGVEVEGCRVIGYIFKGVVSRADDTRVRRLYGASDAGAEGVYPMVLQIDPGEGVDRRVASCLIDGVVCGPHPGSSEGPMVKVAQVERVTIRNVTTEQPRGEGNGPSLALGEGLGVVLIESCELPGGIAHFPPADLPAEQAAIGSLHLRVCVIGQGENEDAARATLIDELSVVDLALYRVTFDGIDNAAARDMTPADLIGRRVVFGCTFTSYRDLASHGQYAPLVWYMHDPASVDAAEWDIAGNTLEGDSLRWSGQADVAARFEEAE